MTTDKYYGKLVETSLDIGERRSSKLQTHPRVHELYGLAGLRTKHFLNSLLSNGKLTYLELGIYRGASLACAVYSNPEIKAYAVDDWRYSPIDHPAIKYDETTKKPIPWPNVKLAALDVISKYTPGNITVIEKNWVDLKKSDVPDPINIVHLQPLPGVTPVELASYLNTIYPLLETTFILVMELHILDLVQEGIAKWAADKKMVINSKSVKGSDSLSNTDHWFGGLGVYVITKQDITK